MKLHRKKLKVHPSCISALIQCLAIAMHHHLRSLVSEGGGVTNH